MLVRPLHVIACRPSTQVLFYSAIIMPDDVAQEKVKALLALGADVERVRPASIVDKKQVCIYPGFSQYPRLTVLASMS